MLVSPVVQQHLKQERELLSQVLALLSERGAPPEAIAHSKHALLNLDESFLLVVVGEFNAGKSSFLNALLRTQALAEGVTPTTDRIYVLLHQTANNAQELQATADPYVVRRYLDVELLAGIAVVDTPGTNAVIQRHQVLTESFLPRADLLIFLTSAERPFSETERQFLQLSQKWGRQVLIVINKADILENEAQEQQVYRFVEEHAREVLGFSPPVYLLSARQEQRGGDPRFAQFRQYLEQRLAETERVKLKLSNPLKVARELLNTEQQRIGASRQLLNSDIQRLQHLEQQQSLYQQEQERELGAHIAALELLLSDFQQRAQLFLQEKMQLGRVLELLNSDKLQAEFQRRVILDLPQQIQSRLEHSVDRFISQNLHFWEETSLAIQKQQEDQALAQPLRQSRFDYNRQALMNELQNALSLATQELDQQKLALQMVQNAQDSVLHSGLSALGGIGLGVGAVMLLQGMMLDFTGILAGLGIIAMGTLFIPARKQAALAKIAQQVEHSREQLRTTLRNSYQHQQQQAEQRLRDLVGPYRRYITAEQQLLDQAEQQLASLLTAIQQQQLALEQL